MVSVSTGTTLRLLFVVALVGGEQKRLQSRDGLFSDFGSNCHFVPRNRRDIGATTIHACSVVGALRFNVVL